ncbi:MAG: trimethylamine methyltransferase family protein, partial [Clostridiales bacterium]
ANPNMSLLAAPMTPLSLEKGIAEATMECALSGVAVVPMSLPQMASTSPATYAGNAVLANAENLACYLTAKCSAEDAPILYSADTGAPNMATMGMEYDYPEYTLLAMANADMARFYGLPSMVAAGMSEHKEFQTVAGFERNVFKSAMALMTRTDLSCSYGSVDHCISSNFADILLDCESYKYAKAFLRSYKCTPEKLAVDIICEVGPQGNYLAHEHTFMNFREELNVYNIEKSFVFDHEADKDYRMVAQEKAEEIWANHEVPAIDEALIKEMDILSEKAHEDLVG